MSQSAIDPETQELRSIEWFAVNQKSVGLCQVCSHEMKRKGRYSEEVTEHFAHANQGTGCPTIPDNRKKYKDLKPSAYDSKNAILIKQQLKQNLLSVFYKTGYLTDGAMTVKIFSELIHVANEKRVWEYVGLRIEFVPYLLTCLYDGMYEIKRFNKERRSLLPAKFFMALEPGIRHIDDLWNKPYQIKQKIWRIFPNQQLVEELNIDHHMHLEPHWFDGFRKKIGDVLGV